MGTKLWVAEEQPVWQCGRKFQAEGTARSGFQVERTTGLPEEWLEQTVETGQRGLAGGAKSDFGPTVKTLPSNRPKRNIRNKAPDGYSGTDASGFLLTPLGKFNNTGDL